ncbi:hypothetical protein N658DRAFT_495639, partial [Parathielavia hyrcaniae]
MDNPAVVASAPQQPDGANKDDQDRIASDRVHTNSLADPTASLDHLPVDTDRWEGLGIAPIKEAIARMHAECGGNDELIREVSLHLKRFYQEAIADGQNGHAHETYLQELRQLLETALQAEMEGLALPEFPPREAILAQRYSHPHGEVDGRIASILSEFGLLEQVERYQETSEGASAPPASDVVASQARRAAEPKGKVRQPKDKYAARPDALEQTQEQAISSLSSNLAPGNASASGSCKRSQDDTGGSSGRCCGRAITESGPTREDFQEQLRLLEQQARRHRMRENGSL